jgi:hypothetical protein
MRFMMFMIPGELSDAEWAEGPSAENVGAMTRYNEELTKAGVLLALDGLHPASAGARVTYSGGKPSVTDGPFAEAKELVGGYWIIQASSKEEAVEWAKRVPAGEHDIVEVRRIFELEDFSPEVQAVGQLSSTPPDQAVER